MTSEAPGVVEIADDDYLPELLDSLGIAALVTLIEDEWAIQFDDSELDPDHFTDLENLAAFIRRKIEHDDAAG